MDFLGFKFDMEIFYADIFFYWYAIGSNYIVSKYFGTIFAISQGLPFGAKSIGHTKDSYVAGTTRLLTTNLLCWYTSIAAVAVLQDMKSYLIDNFKT